MILAKLDGQLGNQMFAYATAYAASKKRNEKLAVYRFEYDTIYFKQGFQIGSLEIEASSCYFGIPVSLYAYTIKKITNQIFGFLGQNTPNIQAYSDNRVDIIPEELNTYTQLVFDETKKIHMITGFRQSHLYFDEYRDELLRQFVPKYHLEKDTKELLDVIEQTPFPVSVHIRRGDYVKIGCCLRMEYYEEAMRQISSGPKKCTFFIFSDDIDWVKENLHWQEYDVFFVDHKQKTKPFSDIWAMTKCKANIIANSSYSWWGAYLNQNVGKMVFAPKKILENNNRIAPEEWIIIDDSLGC